MIFSVKSDTGLIRTINEDSYFVKAEKDIWPRVFVVADGMGGHNAGELASKVAANFSGEVLGKSLKEGIRQDEIVDIIRMTMEETNRMVFEMSVEKEENYGMGTTLIVAAAYKDVIYFGHIGDSRAYLVSATDIKKVTKDHSLVEELLRNGTLTREEADNHPKKNIITRAIGCAGPIEPDVYIEPIGDYHTVLMCTDGLTNMLSEQVIKEHVNSGDSLDIVCNNLISNSNENGGEDNTTVIVFRVGE